MRHTSCTGRDTGYCHYAAPADKTAASDTLKYIVDTRILRVNRQIFAAAQPIPYKENSFMVRTRVNNWDHQIELWTRERANVLALISKPRFDLCPLATLLRGYYKDGACLRLGDPRVVFNLPAPQWERFQTYLRELEGLKSLPTSSCWRNSNMDKNEGVIGYRDTMKWSQPSG